MKRARLVLIGLFAALLPALMAPTGGFPSNPIFQTITLNGTGTAGRQHICNTAASATNKCMGVDVNTSGGLEIFLENDTHGGVNSGLTINRSGASATGMTFTTASGTADISAIDGSFSWSFSTGTSNCSAGASNATVLLHRIGKVVVGEVSVGATCTIASGVQQNTTNAPVPASFRPSLANACGAFPLSLAGNPFGSVCVASSGNIVLNFPTAATTVTVTAGSSFTYTLD